MKEGNYGDVIMEQHVCVKTDLINDIKERVEKIESYDREDYANQKELTATLKMVAVSNSELKIAISEISNTLVKVNNNLDNLNKDNKDIKDDIVELKNDVYNKFDKFEDQFKLSEEKNKLDIRDVKKEEVKLSLKEKVKKYSIPFAAISAFVVSVYELLKGFKILK